MIFYGKIKVFPKKEEVSKNATITISKLGIQAARLRDDLPAFSN